jgi:hypothetical protein
MDSSRGRLRKQVVSSLVWVWWVTDLTMFEFESRTFRYFTFIFVSFGESCLLVSWCAGGMCDMVDSDEDHGRSRRPDAEDWGWLHRSGTLWSNDREVRWRRVRSAPYTWRRGVRVYWLSLKTKVDGLSVVWPQNQWDCLLVVWPQNHCDGLSVVWQSKPLERFLWFGLKTGGDGFSWFGLKTGGSGFWFGPQNRQLRFGDLSFKVTTTVFFCWDLKTKQTLVYRLRLKTDGGIRRRGTRIKM